MQRASDHPQNLDTGKSGPRNEYALILVGGVRGDGTEARRLDMQKIIGQQTFEPIAIAELETDPQASALRPGNEGTVVAPALARFEVPNKTDHFCLPRGNADDTAFRAHQLDRVGFQTARGLDEAL